MIKILNWLFVHASYGVAVAIATVVYVLLRALKKALPKLPDPAFIAVPVFLVAVFSLPSLPRYKFEADTMSMMEGKDWIRVVNKTKWGDLTEPLTWVRTPIGAVTLIMPHDPIEEGTFRRVVMRYGEKPIVSVVEPDCRTLTIIYAEPEGKGFPRVDVSGEDTVFRYTTEHPLKMSAEEKKWYCESDWSKEREALRKAALRQMGEDK